MSLSKMTTVFAHRAVGCRTQTPRGPGVDVGVCASSTLIVGFAFGESTTIAHDKA
jgi:hypothetical protein